MTGINAAPTELGEEMESATINMALLWSLEKPHNLKLQRSAMFIAGGYIKSPIPVGAA